MRKCICGRTIRFPRLAPQSVATSTSTTPGDPIRVLTGRRQTMLTSLACRRSRQPEPGRRSTYPSRNAVQTNRATAEIPVTGNADPRNIVHTFQRALNCRQKLLDGEFFDIDLCGIVSRKPEAAGADTFHRVSGTALHSTI